MTQVESGPIVELNNFPIVAANLPKDEPPHVRLGQGVCDAVTRALALPKSVRVHSRANYATLSTVGAAGRGPEVELRIRVNGFVFGNGAKKDIEYVSISWVGLDASKRVIMWSEDLQAFAGSQAYYDAIHAGKPPPKPKKPNMRDCGKLTFVDGAEKPLPITSELRALVAKVAPPLATAPRTSPASEKARKTKKSR